MKQVFSLLFCCLFFSFFYGQNDSITKLDEVILLDTFTSSEILGITASSILQPAQIRTNSPIDFATTLNQVAGVYLLSGALNTNRITIRGVGARTPFGTDKLRLYFNGIPVTNGTGFSTIEAFDLENLGSIEVIKGPKATAYGTNLGGAILLNTSKNSIVETKLSNNFSVGSYNMLKNNLSFRHSDEKFNLNLNYNHLETDGFRQNNRFKRNGILLTSEAFLGPSTTLGLVLNHIDYNAQIPSSLNQTDFEEDPTRAAGNWLAAQGFEDNKYTLTGLSLEQKLGPSIKNSTSLFYSYLDHYEPRPFNILDEFTNGYGFRTQFEGNLKKSKFVFGAELYKDEYHWGTFQNNFADNNGNGSLLGDRLSKNKEFRNQLNLFGTLTYPLNNNLSIQGGLNLNKTDYDFRDLFNNENNTSAARNFDAILLPSLGIRHQTINTTLYANISHGFSNPGLEETLTPDGVINPEIAQEKGINYELGSDFSFFKNKLSVNAIVYRMNIKDLLVAQRIGDDQFVGRNAGQTRHQGFELEVNSNLQVSKKITVIPYLNYTLSDHSFIDFIDGEDNFSGNPLTGVPKHRIQSGLNILSKKLQLNLVHQFVDEIPLTDANSLSSDSFNVFNMQAKYQTILFSDFNLGLNFGINNIFDINYAQSVLINASSFGGRAPRYFYPGNGRNYYCGLRIQYVL
ncbi:TonB-dependent receptor family protein [Maribacter sp. 2210JD10-5]|uniref:TonB-dependent receptor family protein n=1 Tax=Maribacter sp. 2210JD10-5 TaxID=3386272 RepID=UPI0039BCD877